MAQNSADCVVLVLIHFPTLNLRMPGAWGRLWTLIWAVICWRPGSGGSPGCVWWQQEGCQHGAQRSPQSVPGIPGPRCCETHCELRAPGDVQAFGSFTANLDVSAGTAFKVKAGPWGRNYPRLVPDLLTVLENKVSFVCFLLSHSSACFFLLTLLDTQYLTNAKCFPLRWKGGYEVC